MSGITFNSVGAILSSKETIGYFKDYYNGKIRMGCGEDCEEQCEIDHGYYNPPKYQPLFKKVEMEIEITCINDQINSK